MALNKDFGSKFKNSTYWKVIRFTMSWHEDYLTVIIGGWLSKADRDQNPIVPKFKKMISFNNDDFDFDIAEPITSQIYTKIKAIPEWSGATDV